MNRRNAAESLRQYGKVSIQTEVETATPHRLVQMLMEGALARVAAAKGHMKRAEIAAKGEAIGSAISIIDGLRVSLDINAGGEISSNLERLYRYMGERLLHGHHHNEIATLDEVHGLLREIKSGWDGVPDPARTVPAQMPARIAAG